MRKFFILLFICAVSGATHLELTTDVGTDSAILALGRLIRRRGKANYIISDNFKYFEASTLKRFLAHQGIKWSFILERSPCWGGFYERLVAIVKNSLKKGVLTSKLSLDELQAVIIEIDNVISSRPLTHLEDQLYENLTPYHLIYGRNLASKRTDKEIK